MVVAAVDDKGIKAYSFRELEKVRRKIYFLAWSCNGQRIAAGCADGNVRTWVVEPHGSVAKPEKVDAELKGHSDTVSHLAWRPGHPDVLASTTHTDKSVRLWDARSRKSSATIATGAGNDYLAWSPDGTQLAISTNRDTLAVLDVRKSKMGRETSLKQQLYQTVWGPGQGTLLAASRDGTVEALVQGEGGPGTWDKGLSLRGHTAECYCLDLSSDGRTLVSGGADAVVCVWDLPSAACSRTFYHIDDAVRTVSLSHDTRYVAWGTESGAIQVGSTSSWETTTIATLRDQKVECVAWSPTHPVLAFAKDSRLDDRSPDVMGAVMLFAPPRA